VMETGGRDIHPLRYCGPRTAAIQSPVFSPAPSPTAPSPSPVYTAPPGYSYGYASVRVSDGFSAASLMKTLMLSDSVVVKDGGVI